MAHPGPVPHSAHRWHPPTPSGMPGLCPRVSRPGQTLGPSRVAQQKGQEPWLGVSPGSGVSGKWPHFCGPGPPVCCTALSEGRGAPLSLCWSGDRSQALLVHRAVCARHLLGVGSLRSRSFALLSPNLPLRGSVSRTKLVEVSAAGHLRARGTIRFQNSGPVLPSQVRAQAQGGA